MLKINLGLLMSLFYTLSLAQSLDFDSNYDPIKFQGKIPAEFLIDARELSKEEIKKNKELSKSGAQDYFVSSNYIQNSIMNSGYVYFNDPLSEMVNKVASQLLVHVDSEDADKLRFYVTKFDVPNAFCWRNGYVYMNVGLLKDLENEAQLAFILSHEIIHYLEQHSITFYKATTNALSKSERKKEKKKKKELGEVIDKDLTKVLEQLKFSREQETEADLEGLKLFAKTNYDLMEAVNALKVLAKYREKSNYFIPTDLFALFNNESFQIDTSDLYDNEVLDTVYLETDEIEEDSLEFYSTHPDIEKRIEAVSAEMENDGKKEGVLFNFYEKQWADYKTIIDFELVNYYDDKGDYANVFYKTLTMLQRYPDNVYLVSKYAKSLFWLSLYRDNGKVKRLSKREVVNDKTYVLYSINKFLKEKNFTKSQFENLETKYPQNSTIKLYHLRYKEFVKNKSLKAEYSKLDNVDSEFSTFIKYKSKNK